MKTLSVKYHDNHKIIIGNEDNRYLITLNFPKWSTDEVEQKQLDLDKDNLLTLEVARKILERLNNENNTK